MSGLELLACRWAHQAGLSGNPGVDGLRQNSVLSVLMARPRGYRLNPYALGDVLKTKRLTLTEAASQCGMPLTTLSSLSHDDCRASIKTVQALSAGLGCAAETLFPELAFDMRAAS